MFALRARAPGTLARLQERTIASSAVRASTGAHMVDPEKAADELEEGKRQSVSGNKDNTVSHAPGWNEKIASESEAIVKAVKDNKKPEELAKETINKLKQDPGVGTKTK